MEREGRERENKGGVREGRRERERKGNGRREGE